MAIYHTTSSKTAYTLLELSLVLVVLSLLIAGIMSIITQTTRRIAMAEVNRKMDVIEAKLIDFRRLNNRLPCPADGTQPITSQYFGIEAGSFVGLVWTPTYGDCYSAGTIKANFSDGSNTVGGDIPIKTLGLSDDYMFDPWGGRFFYAVDKRMTAAAAFTTYTVTSTSIGSITVNDGSSPANAKVTAISGAGGAIAVFMSYGSDGHGAYQLSGTRKSTGNTNNNTQTNCYCNNASPPAANPFGATFIQAPATSTSPNDPSNFDDIVRYYTRRSFLNSTDVSMSR